MFNTHLKVFMKLLEDGKRDPTSVQGVQWHSSEYCVGDSEKKNTKQTKNPKGSLQPQSNDDVQDRTMLGSPRQLK